MSKLLKEFKIKDSRRPYKEFGLLLKRTRKRLGLKQTEVAKLLGIDSSNLCFYERGRNMPGLAVGLRLMKVLSLRPESLSQLLQLDTVPTASEFRELQVVALRDAEQGGAR